MEPISDVPLKDVGKWAEKNLKAERVGRQMMLWWSAYNKVTFHHLYQAITHICGLLSRANGGGDDFLFFNFK